MTQPYLIPELNPAHFGDNRKFRHLFLPKLLEEQARHKYLTTSQEFKDAYQIVCKWAELERKGKLSKQKETTLEGEFVTEVFGKALGYSLFSEDKDQWELEQKFSINGGIADAVIGQFRPAGRKAVAVIELKGPTVNLDRDRFDGRTAVQQCWDYLYALPDCPWGIVCNFVSFRLYHRNQTTRAFELFTLQELTKLDVFQKFYCIFQRDGFLKSKLNQEPRAEVLLEKSIHRELEVGDKLYDYYHQQRINLIDYLTSEHHGKNVEEAIRITQRLIDRIVFIAFCEDRGLLPNDTIKRAWEQVPAFTRAVNPRWQNFIDLFYSIDKGNKRSGISPFNGGLFRKDPEVDDLQIDDEYTNIFRNIGDYDFRDEINVDVLGHLFEKSVNDIERLRFGGFFSREAEPQKRIAMTTSAERKRFGIYYTPSEFTEFIVYNTIGRLARQRFDKLAETMQITREWAETVHNDPTAERYWRQCLEILKDIKIVDPACGSGAFLIKAYDAFEELYHDIRHHLHYQGCKTDDLEEQIPDWILNLNIHGVDLSREAVEITQLALWIRSARKGKTLADLSDNILWGNSLVADPAVHPEALDWEGAFPTVFQRKNPGFDCVVGNPPWERMKLQEREFFDGRDSAIATAVSAAQRRELIERLHTEKPELYHEYSEALQQADSNMSYVRNSGLYPLTGKGDINMYAIFAELAYRLVNPKGLVGFLVPSGIATDNTTKDFFSTLVSSKVLSGLYDFENKAPIFQDVHRSYKFSVLLFGGKEQQSEATDYVFFAHQMADLKEKARHIPLSAKDIQMMNPNTLTCPIFRSRRDAEITKAIYRRVPVLIDKMRKEGGNLWGIKFCTMFHQTSDAELFRTAEQLKLMNAKRDGALWKKGKEVYLPLYEAKMYRQYDHRFGSVYIEEKNWVNQGQTIETTLVEHQNPEFFVMPRWWISKDSIPRVVQAPYYFSFRDVTRATDSRTMIASFLPVSGVLNTAPLILKGEAITDRYFCCLLANFNSFALDFVVRQKIGHIHLNFFIVEQLPVLSPDSYDDICPWRKSQKLVNWISDRVLKLTCTSDDMLPLAKAAGFEPGVHKWKDSERARLIAELDAAYFILYGIERDDVVYMLSTFGGIAKQTENIFEDQTVKLILEYYDAFKGGSRN